VSIVSVVVGVVAGLAPIVLSSQPGGWLFVFTHWLFIGAFAGFVIGAIWQSIDLILNLRESTKARSR
jgi:uncharacterized membrane protein